MSVTIPKEFRLLRGPESRLPKLIEGQPAVTTDTCSLYIGTSSGNIRFPDESEIARASASEAILGTNDNKIITPKTLDEVIQRKVNGGVYQNNMFLTGFTTGSFTAQQTLSQFQIPNYSKNNVYILTYVGVVLHEGENYTLNDTGSVTLGWQLGSGETIRYLVFKGGFDYIDIRNTPKLSNNPMDEGDEILASASSVKKVNDKINMLIERFDTVTAQLLSRIQALENSSGIGGPVRLVSSYGNRDSKKVKVQLHTHCTRSDGKQTTSEVQQAYKDKGYAAMAITNHNSCEARTEIEGFFMYRGIEESTGTGHLGIINVKSSGDKFNTTVSGERSWSKVTAHHRSFNDDRFIICNHPTRDGDVFPNEVLLEMDYDMMEVYNSKYDETTATQLDYVLNNGRKVWCVAVDDCHDVTDVNNFSVGYIEVYADTINKAYIYDKMVNGEMIASVGHTFDITTTGNTINVTAPAPTTFEFISNGSVVHTVSNVTSTSFEVKHAHIGYIRVVATLNGSTSKRAYSQPMYVEAL